MLLRLEGLRLLVFGSSWLVCRFSLAFLPLPGGWPAGRSCSCPASGARRTHPTLPLCLRLPPSCGAEQLQPRLLELWRWSSKALWGFEALVFWGNMSGIQIVDITLNISCNLSALLSKQKISTSQECEAAKCEAWCSHLHISPRRLFQPQLSWVCFSGQNKKKVDVPFHFFVLCKSYLWYAHKRSGKFSLCPKLIVASNDKLSLE